MKDKFKDEIKEYKVVKESIDKLIIQMYMMGYLHGNEMKREIDKVFEHEIENVRGFKNDKRKNSNVSYNKSH